MKNVNPQRFGRIKPEEIAFNGSPLPDTPPVMEPPARNERTNERSEKRPERRQAKPVIEQPAAGSYVIEVPVERAKTRHSFDIFEDQKAALSKIQLAAVDAGHKKKQPLGDMLQEAIDDYITKKVGEMPNIKLVREQKVEKTNERSDVRPDKTMP